MALEIVGRRMIIQPLLFDRVMEGRPRQSQSRLIQLPSELLGCIVALLADDKITLASLALVNSDCRQLARSCQFVRVSLNPELKPNLCQKLLDEHSLRNSTSRKPTIGACIRRIYFSCLSMDLDNSYYSHRQSAIAHDRFHGIILAIDEKSMPNLGHMIWDGVLTYDSLFTQFSHSSIQHLRVREELVGTDYISVPPVSLTSLPLRSLGLHTSISSRRVPSIADNKLATRDPEATLRPMSELNTIIFQRCASTLESLEWSYDGRGYITSFGDTPVSFPRLRTLNMGDLRDASKSIFESLLAAPLRHLTLPFCPDKVDIKEPLQNCATLTYLESLAILGSNKRSEVMDTIAGFLVRHSHIKKLHIGDTDTEGSKGQVRNLYLVPMLSENFTNLRSLWLQFGCRAIDSLRMHNNTFAMSESSLGCIRKITSLEKLYISVGPSSWFNKWLVHHGQLQDQLLGLNQLKMLAFSGDTYSFSTTDPGKYYERRFAGITEILESNARPELDDSAFDVANFGIWETAHRNRMLDQAEKYASMLPNLEWIFCGQRQMGIVRNSAAGELTKAVPLTPDRRSCRNILGLTFGVKSRIT